MGKLILMSKNRLKDLKNLSPCFTWTDKLKNAPDYNILLSCFLKSSCPQWKWLKMPLQGRIETKVKMCTLGTEKTSSGRTVG